MIVMTMAWLRMNLSGRTNAANRGCGSWREFEFMETVSHWFVDESEVGKLWEVIKTKLEVPILQYTVNVCVSVT